MGLSVPRSLPGLALAAFFVAVCTTLLNAGILPLKVYTIADGLAMDQVNAICQDSRGLLWFGTSDGVSWFDGYQFVTYTTDDGLPDKLIYDVLETRSGELWFGTSNGVCRLRRGQQEAGGRFETFRPAQGRHLSIAGFQVARMMEGPDGSIWCGAFQGLFRLSRRKGTWVLEAVSVNFRDEKWADAYVRDLLFDGSGTLWIATNSGLYRRTPEGLVKRFGVKEGIPENECFVLEPAPDGEFWLGTNDGVFRLRSVNQGDTVRVAAAYTVQDGLPSNRVLALKSSRNGRLWIGTYRGLASLEPTNPGHSQAILRSYTAADGLTDPQIDALAEDREQNLWLGTDHGGALKISRHGFETFNTSTGLPANWVNLAFRDSVGHVGFQFHGQGKSFSVWDGDRFLQVKIPGSERFDWIGPQGVLQDHTGGWWLATGKEGLWRYPPTASFTDLAGRLPSRRYTQRDGLSSARAFALYQDSRHDIWIALSAGSSMLARLDWQTGRLTTFQTARMPTAFTEDHAGNIWIGFLGTEIWRVKNDRIARYTSTEGFPSGSTYQLSTDKAGQVWIASRVSGAVRIPDPDADHPRFSPLTTRSGLSSNHARFVIQDQKGIYYIGTARGLDRWDPGRATMRHFTTGDGLAGNLQNIGLLEQDGTLWFGTLSGLSRLVPEAEIDPQPPGIFVRGLRLGGIPWPIDPVGQPAVTDVVVPLDRNTVSIDFAGVSFVPGEVLNYRYRLEGQSGWRSLSSQRSLDLVNVQPGTYRVELRAVNSVGVESPVPALVEFTILVPFWRRWWFVMGVVVLVGLAVLYVMRSRLYRRLEMERVRTRIATDLHDDIGASLSQISILCEVAVRRLPDDPSSAVENMSQVSIMTRSLIDTMSDIVWAINPARDSLDDLIHRMRRFANDLFGDGSIEHRFGVSGADGKIGLSNDFRRQVYLIYKECLNNIVRHSCASEARIEIRLGSGCLEAEISDNGVGFDMATVRSDGAGLSSLRNRAEALGGVLTINARPNAGTRILCRIPMSGTTWRQRLTWRGCKPF